MAHCDMADDMLVSQRVYSYAMSHGLLDRQVFHAEYARGKLESPRYYLKTPKYFRNAISCLGLSFSNLKEMPTENVFRACRDSDDGTIHVGALVWRAPVATSGLDGLNFV